MEWRQVRREDGSDIAILLHQPSGPQRRRPVLVWAHGGGFVGGSPLTVLSRTAALCHEADVVVSVDYRLLPEHRFPQNREDVVAVVKWIVDGGLGEIADPHRIVVGGDSGGGNLAAATCIVARDEGLSGIVGQLLEAPVLDFSDTSKAYLEAQRDAPGLAAGLHESHVRAVAFGAVPGDPLSEPLTLPDTRGLPAAFLLACEVDPLHDDTFSYAAHLASGGVPVEVVLVEGMSHGTQSFTTAFHQAARAQRRMVTWLREVTEAEG